MKLLLCIFIFLGYIQIFAEEAPSSKIPERREFPINSSVNPCEDFHAYVCSKAESQFKLREDRSMHVFAFNDSSERLLEAKKTFMKNIKSEKKLPLRAQQFKDFYMSCMDQKSRAKEEKSKVSSLVSKLEQIKTTDEFINFMSEQHFNGGYSFLLFSSNPNLDNAKKLDAFFTVNLMSLPDHSYYEKMDLIESYKNLLIKFYQTANPKLTTAAATAKADQQLALQKEFIKTYPIPSIRRQRFSERRISTQKETLEKYPNLGLEKYLSKIPKDTVVSIPIPEGLEFLKINLKDENIEIYKDLYLYKAASNWLDESAPDFFKERFDFNKKYFGGPAVRSDLQERCTTAVSNDFTMEIDQFLMTRLFPNFKDERVQEIVEKIRASILSGIEKNTWLSPEARTEALRKIKTAKLQLVRPKTDKEWDFLPIQKYSTKNYLANFEIQNKAQLEKTYEDLKHPANQDAWGMGPLTVNAYYSANENKFVLPMGILQYPFYDESGTITQNLGAVGMVVAHELGHSVDDQGSKFDADGKLHQWMTMKDLAEFNKRGQKMIEQFNQAGHNGSLTQGENIADLVGVTFAHSAAFPMGEGSIEEQKNFFESYARVWCSVSRPDFEKKLLKTDPHSMGWARINEQVKHQPEFSKAYACKSTDKMVLPEKNRIQIW